MNQRVVHPRRGAVTGSASGHQSHARGQLFGRTDVDPSDMCALDGRAAAFGHGEFGVNLGEVLAHHEVDADASRIGFFARFGEEDHVAIQLDAQALQHQHRDEIGGQHRLVVLAAASPDVAVLHDRAERIHGPLLALHADHVGMGQNQQGPLGPVALQARDQVGTSRDPGRRCWWGCLRSRAPSSSSRPPASRGRPWCRSAPGPGSARGFRGRASPNRWPCPRPALARVARRGQQPRARAQENASCRAPLATY